MVHKCKGKYHIIVFGCQMSEHDSEVIAGQLEEMGYLHTAEQSEADIILLVTCCVRETAENKVWGLLGRLRKLKQNKPDLVIGVSGCLPQQKDMGKNIKQRFPHVDLIFGTHNIHELPRLINQLKESQETVLEIWSQADTVKEGVPVRRAPGIKAWVTIMYGCNNFCTYCIVPYVRGRERSRKPEDIILEIEELVQQGYKDITLLGQNVNSYGKDFTKPFDFADLLLRLNQIEGLERLRYTTSHPRDFTDKLIDVVAQCDRVCENFHLPVQAGSNRILKKMNRGYSREEYLELINKIRDRVPKASITTDIMVGFPGETDEDFEDTMDIVRQVKYDSAFTFVYNIRKGTPAAKMPDQVPENIKTERIQKLIALQNEISLANNQALVGEIEEVLVEGPTKNNDNKIGGRSRTNKLVIFTGGNNLTGKIVPVKIKAGHLTHLEGDYYDGR
ncbi:tRNA (N6-isopentenyl adenosine(37)-C2)-methylthiotransferase MiaB [Desulfofalx alkaliphila]|uniref:tRNA (N6-isopentenyl adenosine(37)-C2)-methylthiotransferase MiaB n=1 Tax=Desulfofalx alkaliphila TaxID=105483 RepID=UPI001EE3C209|nr:tRNA (N6-isopentenyl adenosine(37)-C2)-methylthiotransferase MiaB [Desulfofalx alkaliphila]